MTASRAAACMVVPLLVAAASPALPAKLALSVQDATLEDVRACRDLGQVLGESAFCVKSSAKKDASVQALALGATHIVWVDVKCVVMVGEKAIARVFDCNKKAPSLDEVFEDYLLSNPSLARRTVNWTGPVSIMTSNDLDGDAVDLLARGYVLVGFVGVSGDRVALSEIRKKTIDVGAEVALLHANNVGADTEYRTTTRYRRGTASVGFSVSQVNGAVAGQQVGVTGTSTAIVGNPGSTQTEVVPYAERKYETQVLFWRKLSSGALGLTLDLIPVDLRQRLSRNTGAFVIAVEDETPGFFANIVRGDIIIEVNGTEVRTPGELEAIVAKPHVSSFSIRILRNGDQLEVEVRR